MTQGNDDFFGDIIYYTYVYTYICTYIYTHIYTQIYTNAILKKKITVTCIACKHISRCFENTLIS